jgi:hypothetical protein
LAIVVASRFGDFNFAFCTGDGEAGSSINEGVPVLHACGSHDDGLREGRAGREFSSSWKKTAPTSTVARSLKIKKGESTRTDVVHLLGNPWGKYIYPVIPNPSEEAINYLYHQKASAP